MLKQIKIVVLFVISISCSADSVGFDENLNMLTFLYPDCGGPAINFIGSEEFQRIN